MLKVEHILLLYSDLNFTFLESVSQTDLCMPTRVDITQFNCIVCIVCECGNFCCSIHFANLQWADIVVRTIVFAPMFVNQVAEIDNVECELQFASVYAFRDEDVFCHVKVNTIFPRSSAAVTF